MVIHFIFSLAFLKILSKISLFVYSVVFVILENTTNPVRQVFPVPQASAASRDISDAYIIHGGKMSAVQQVTHAEMVWSAGCVTNHMPLVS